MATEENAPLHVETEVFEGPFDLLLHLVHVNEMDIFDINIAEITDRFDAQSIQGGHRRRPHSPQAPYRHRSQVIEFLPRRNDEKSIGLGVIRGQFRNELHR